MVLKKVSAVLLSAAFFGGCHTANASWSDIKNKHGTDAQELEAVKGRLKSIDKTHLEAAAQVKLCLAERDLSCDVCKNVKDVTREFPEHPFVQLVGKVIYSRDSWFFNAVIGRNKKGLPEVFSFPISKDLGMLKLPGGAAADKYDDIQMILLTRTQRGRFVYAWVDGGPKGDFNDGGYVKCLSRETALNSWVTPMTPDDMAALDPGNVRKYVPPREKIER